jgi:hypothetical protein
MKTRADAEGALFSRFLAGVSRIILEATAF